MKHDNWKIEDLPGILWCPDDAPKAAILVLHGMTEHAGRYEAFARHMAGQSIAVAAYDLRGHGCHAPNAACAAMAPGDWAKSIQDIGQVLAILRSRFPGTPLFLLGFSLGSFLAREYLNLGNPNADGIILMGTGTQPGIILKLMGLIVKSQIRQAGFMAPTPLVRKLAFGPYNDKFKPNQTESDWLCSDPEELNRYLADPLCRRDISSGTFYELLGSMDRTRNFRKTPEKYPVLLISGTEDPVGSFTAGVRKLENLVIQSGYDCAIHLEPGARHALLHEISGGQAANARAAILNWIDQHI